MTTYSVIIGSPPGGSILPSGTLGNFEWLTKASTPAERLNIAFRFGNAGSAPKSGCMKARYSISANSPGSGQMRISRSGSCSAKVSRHAFALPIRLSRSTMSSAIPSPRAASKTLNRHSREGGNPGHPPRRLLLDPRFRGVTRVAWRTNVSGQVVLSPCSGLRGGVVEIGDVAGRSHVAQPRSPRHRECRDRGLVFVDLGHDRFLGAVEDAAVGGDEMLRLAQAGEIPVDLRHDVARHHIPAAHRVFRVGPVVDK